MSRSQGRLGVGVKIPGTRDGTIILQSSTSGCFFGYYHPPKKSTTISGYPQSTKHRGDSSFKEALEIAVQDNDTLLGGGFKVGEVIQIGYIIFFKQVGSTTK